LNCEFLERRIMARPLRIEFPGAIYHLTNRGNAGQTIFEDDVDRIAFLSVLGDVVDRMGWLCHAYCLMENHYHLMAETPEANLSDGMRRLNGTYTQRFNRRHERFGHLFQGRYKAILVERESHLLELCRYVVLNPVRAGLVRSANAFPWSSYRATAGGSPAPRLLTTDWLLAQFAKRRQAAQRRYRAFVAEGKGLPGPWPGLKGGILLGGAGFAERLRARLENAELSDEVPRRQRRLAAPGLDSVLAPAAGASLRERNRHIVAAHLRHGYSLSEIADRLGLHYSTISKIVTASHSNNSQFKT
jgi:REP element-mobilizing transposase RayT